MATKMSLTCMAVLADVSMKRRPLSSAYACASCASSCPGSACDGAAAGAAGKRYSLPHSRIMVHQPSGGFQGQATDIEIHAREILSLRARLNEIYVTHTGQDLKVIEDAMERDKFLDPEEAKEFGIIDEVVSQRPAPAAGDGESE